MKTKTTGRVWRTVSISLHPDELRELDRAWMGDRRRWKSRSQFVQWLLDRELRRGR